MKKLAMIIAAIFIFGLQPQMAQVIEADVEENDIDIHSKLEQPIEFQIATSDTVVQADQFQDLITEDRYYSVLDTNDEKLMAVVRQLFGHRMDKEFILPKVRLWMKNKGSVRELKAGRLKDAVSHGKWIKVSRTPHSYRNGTMEHWKKGWYAAAEWSLYGLVVLKRHAEDLYREMKEIE